MRPLSIPDEKILRIWKALEGLKYGTVLITVHDSNIVQIDRTEKHRFSSEPASLPKNRTAAGNKK
ncbi:MAG: YezD family protein [Thermoactinomyces sp.]